MHRTFIFLFFVACLSNVSTVFAQTKEHVAALSKALADKDLDGVHAAVAAVRLAFKHKAGVPEEPDEFRRVPAGSLLLTRDEAKQGFSLHFHTLEKMRWWKVGLDPTKLTSPLRGPASVITGNVAAFRAQLDGAEQSLEVAKDAAEFLMWAQSQAGSGVYPFPAAVGTSDARAMEVATKFLADAQKAGKIDEVVRNGWAFDDFGAGGLQFDNGECGVAMFELYEITNDPRHLESARRAADWAVQRPLCTNWNYNSFSVYLLAKAYAVTKDTSYLDSTILKTRIGVIPGQLTDGPHAGRWIDPHNARPAYHYIMMRALAQLAAVMRQDHPNRAEVMSSLTLGLKARNTEMVSRGVMTKDHATEALILVNRLFAGDTVFMHETKSCEALAAIGQLISAEFRRRKPPLSPGPWGLYLEFIATAPATQE